MPSGSAYELAILLSLKDMASGGLDRFEDRLRATGKEGKQLLQTVQDLRKDMRSGMAMAGVGVATLSMLKKGVDAAAEYEAAMLDLKSAYQEVESAGGLSANTQAAQLNKLETLATRLGNNLQGTTQDYVGILTALKQAGVDTETVLNGAGEAAANLANVSGTITRGMAREQAKELGQFGKLFQLKPEDFVPSVNLFSALKDRFDIESSSLIEGAKYFSATAQKLDQRGLGGASDVSKLFALLKRQGALEGSQAGTSTTSFFQQFIAHADKVKKLKQEMGIDLQLFDPKTNQFKGWENAFKQMEQFRKLKGEKQLGALNEIFGEQGGKVAGIMVEAGAEGWRNVTSEANKAVPVQEKINQLLESYNAKWESLTGTLTNLNATVFTPMLSTLKPILDLTNYVLGGFQGWAKEHPEISKYVTTGAGILGILLGITGAIKAGRAAWRLYSIASMAAIDDVGAKASGLKGKLGWMGGLKLGLGLTIASLAIQKITADYMELQELRVQQRKASKDAADITNRAAPAPKIDALPIDKKAQASFWEVLGMPLGVPVTAKARGRDMSPEAIKERLKPENVWKERALIDYKNLTGDKQLQYATDRSTMSYSQRVNPARIWPGMYPMESWTGSFDVNRVAKGLPATLDNAGTMKEFRKILSSKLWSGDITSLTRTNTEEALGKRFPQSYEQASQMLAQELANTADRSKGLGLWFEKLLPPIQETGGSLDAVTKSSKGVPPAFGQATNAAKSFADDVRNIKLPKFFGGLGGLFGSDDDKDDKANTRNSKVRAALNGAERGDSGRQTVAVNYSPKVDIRVSGSNGQVSKQKMEQDIINILWDNSRELERIIEMRLSKGEERA